MREIKEFLKKFYWIKFFYLYLKQIYFKIFYSTIKSKEKYIKKQFKKYLGYEIDFDKEPETFNQKIQYRKLYDNNPLYSICSDKYRVREYVKEKIGEEYLVPLYLVTDKLTEEQWDKLPNSFVAKANHDSGTVKIIKDKSKVDKKKIIKELNMSLKIDYGILSMERYYSDITRNIVIEKLLVDKTGEVPKDYKFHCFKNKMIIQVDTGRFSQHRQDFYDEKWSKIFLECLAPNNTTEEAPKKPPILNKMIEKVKILSEKFDYVRIDIYMLENEIYFGEMTFCPWSGLTSFKPHIWDKEFGDYWGKER